MGSEEGIIYSYILDGKGGGRHIAWDEIDTWSPGQGVLWLHLDCSSEKACAWLNEQSGLSPVNVEALLAEETRPRLVPSAEGIVFILRGVNFNPGADPEDMVALRMWFEENRIITMRHRKVMAIDDISNAMKSGRGPVDASGFLVMVSDRISDRIGDIVSNIDDAVDELEDEVLTARSHELRARLSDIRRQTISLRRYIAPQRDVMNRLHGERIPWLRDLDRIYVREVSERTVRSVEDLDAARDRAAITMEELQSRLSDQMNRTMYVLSIVAAIFLPLGFLTGLLGINVGGIPGADSPLGFLTVCLLVAVIVLTEYLILKKMKWL